MMPIDISLALLWPEVTYYFSLVIHDSIHWHVYFEFEKEVHRFKCQSLLVSVYWI